MVLDAWSRRVVGWSMANHLQTRLVLDALDMAVGQRRPRDVIHHSVHGVFSFVEGWYNSARRHSTLGGAR